MARGCCWCCRRCSPSTARLFLSIAVLQMAEFIVVGIAFFALRPATAFVWGTSFVSTKVWFVLWKQLNDESRCLAKVAWLAKCLWLALFYVVVGDRGLGAESPIGLDLLGRISWVFTAGTEIAVLLAGVIAVVTTDCSRLVRLMSSSAVAPALFSTCLIVAAMATAGEHQAWCFAVAALYIALACWYGWTLTSGATTSAVFLGWVGAIDAITLATLFLVGERSVSIADLSRLQEPSVGRIYAAALVVFTFGVIAVGLRCLGAIRERRRREAPRRFRDSGLVESESFISIPMASSLASTPSPPSPPSRAASFDVLECDAVRDRLPVIDAAGEDFVVEL